MQILRRIGSEAFAALRIAKVKGFTFVLEVAASWVLAVHVHSANRVLRRFGSPVFVMMMRIFGCHGVLATLDKGQPSRPASVLKAKEMDESRPEIERSAAANPRVSLRRGRRVHIDAVSSQVSG